jgi:hypothetical protein
MQSYFTAVQVPLVPGYASAQIFYSDGTVDTPIEPLRGKARTGRVFRGCTLRNVTPPTADLYDVPVIESSDAIEVPF